VELCGSIPLVHPSKSGKAIKLTILATAVMLIIGSIVIEKLSEIT